MLKKFRVLDLSTEEGSLCGKILGDLGADVIKIERPGGNADRRIGAFYKGILDPEKSLNWYAFNNNKRGITLDIESLDGRKILEKLIETADCVVESFPVGHMKSLGLDYMKINEINKRIILTSISPFGQDGPYKDYKGSDLVCMAMGGFLYLCGDPDRPPVGIGLPHGYYFAGADAAAATMIAYYQREKSGVGQWVDVSIQQSVALTSFNSVPWWQLDQFVQKRMGPFRRIGIGGGRTLRQMWPCKDGFVIFILTAGAFGVRNNEQLTAWMDTEGLAPKFMKEMDWKAFDAKDLTEDIIKSFDEHVEIFFKSHTMKELYDGAFERGMQLYPVSNCQALAENAQLEDRAFWQPVEHPELGDQITYPGGWVKLTEADCTIRRRAPLIGEHNKDVYIGELGLSIEDLSLLKQAGVI